MKNAIFAAALVFMSACATGQTDESAPAGGTAETLDIRIQNNLIPPVNLRISLVPTSGVERNLGDAFPSRVSSFRYNGLAPRGQYRLVGRATDDRYMASDILVLDGVRAIEWNLQSNRVTILSTANDN
jgi:hypothetical protein